MQRFDKNVIMSGSGLSTELARVPPGSAKRVKMQAESAELTTTYANDTPDVTF